MYWQGLVQGFRFLIPLVGRALIILSIVVLWSTFGGQYGIKLILISRI
ncbi:hypothetical protein VIBNISOn1_360006 [Vibrio nigripulchritudo SOn1]|uniref:Uncharacterized protein n=1 Tax=Vibrio nigripulchritudo SOn1 TaxID=1238450 RepID=A0AAV2VT55_9VIBR|nr:hypothetical protein VIBNISOn1_360006 [Vibrio nigripulchritudo SOn1]